MLKLKIKCFPPSFTDVIEACISKKSKKDIISKQKGINANQE
jgi:hypothetical protein